MRLSHIVSFGITPVQRVKDYFESIQTAPAKKYVSAVHMLIKAYKGNIILTKKMDVRAYDITATLGREQKKLFEHMLDKQIQLRMRGGCPVFFDTYMDVRNESCTRKTPQQDVTTYYFRSYNPFFPTKIRVASVNKETIG